MATVHRIAMVQINAHRRVAAALLRGTPQPPPRRQALVARGDFSRDSNTSSSHCRGFLDLGRTACKRSIHELQEEKMSTAAYQHFLHVLLRLVDRQFDVAAARRKARRQSVRLWAKDNA